MPCNVFQNQIIWGIHLLPWTRRPEIRPLSQNLKSRLILPWKSDCPPVFLKMQGTYSLYAKFWLVRPLNDWIHDSAPRYLSNITFGTSIAFQMRKYHIFLKKYFFENWTSRGVNSAVTHFYTQFKHVSRYFWALNQKHKIIRKNCFQIVVSDVWYNQYINP